MNRVHSMLAAWIIAAPAAGFAASAAASPQPDNPQAPVPALGYSSALTDYQAASQAGQTPDQNWRDANERVAAIGTRHAGHGQQSADHTGHAMDSQPAAPAMDHSKMNHGRHSMPMGHGQHDRPMGSKKASPPADQNQLASPDDHQGHAH